MTDEELYSSPLASRYAGRAMLECFGPRRRIGLWRRLWIALARAQRELGLPIDGPALDRLEAVAGDIDFEAVARYEAELRHDVMAHLHAFGDLVPAAKGSLHIGATSCFVTDNADLIVLRQAIELVRRRLAGVLSALAAFARTERDRPVLGRTHLQPAQPTTLGKRACLWAQDLVFDLEDLTAIAGGLRFRSIKGTTGTQDSFLALFDGDADKVLDLEARLCAAFGFEASYAVTGQTYPRKVDARILGALSGVGQSLSRFAGDIRILSMTGELAEPQGDQQVGSSAMPYKRNPMRSERINALARHLITLSADGAWTAAEQRLERTLDDSANRRIALAEAFLTTDAILRLAGNVVRGLVVDPEACHRILEEQRPFLMTERMLMRAARAGHDRQAFHEKLRTATRTSRDPREVLARMESDPDLVPFIEPAQSMVGLAGRQVDRFLATEVDPLLAGFDDLESDWDLRV